jgi:hypothetical protein
MSDVLQTLQQRLAEEKQAGGGPITDLYNDAIVVAGYYQSQEAICKLYEALTQESQ